MSQKQKNKTTSEVMAIIYIVNCLALESGDKTIKVANTLTTFWSIKKKHKIEGHSDGDLEKESDFTGIASRPFG